MQTDCLNEKVKTQMYYKYRQYGRLTVNKSLVQINMFTGTKIHVLPVS